MLRTITRLDKLAAAWKAFSPFGMMNGTTASYTAMVIRALSLYCHVNNVNTYRDDGSLHFHIWTCKVWATWQWPGKVSQGQKGIVRN
jgi:hypothetical protein